MSLYELLFTVSSVMAIYRVNWEESTVLWKTISYVNLGHCMVTYLVSGVDEVNGNGDNDMRNMWFCTRLM
jgi:hypothetical protein